MEMNGANDAIITFLNLFYFMMCSRTRRFPFLEHASTARPRKMSVEKFAPTHREEKLPADGMRCCSHPAVFLLDRFLHRHHVLLCCVHGQAASGRGAESRHRPTQLTFGHQHPGRRCTDTCRPEEQLQSEDLPHL
ncbi:hypothetical protein F2P81_000675 [Scophthalmus maximus]|uniref:Uncharacterized protein n=1 Tax=Scophthalmus maximus TaxID=52904 RepID=A0A6A4TYA6_SCOMX|nr:hypothetical protein F2P81_000675 [Scophthalmus maximus]